jgi:apolipoprotein N-acyltransferase
MTCPLPFTGALPKGREALLLIVAGGLGALGFAPLGLWPLTLAALAVLMARVMAAQGPGRALLVGWLWGWGHFAVGTNWIATAFTYQAQMPAWLGWIAVLMLAVYLALFPALAGLMGWWLARRWALAPIPALAACWILAEWVRGWLFTGFPWNPLAAATLGGFDRPGLARLLPWTGTYALSGLVVVLAGLWLLAVGAARQGRRGRGLALALVPMALFLAPLGGDSGTGSIPFTLVQPNIGQDEINDPTRYEAQFTREATLSLPLHPGARRYVFWPESGVPDLLREGYEPGWYAASTYGGDPLLARAHGPGDRAGRGAADRGDRPDLPQARTGRRVERGDRARFERGHRGQLCQGPPRALWRISALAPAAHPARPLADGRRGDRRLARPRPAHARFRCIRAGQGRHPDLLRNRLPGPCGRPRASPRFPVHAFQ